MLRFIRLLYDGNRCRISLRGGSFAGFEIGAGIRQGCPLSPLLFAIVADAFLRSLGRLLAPGGARAYADDTAALVTNLQASAPVIEAAFRRFAVISGLELNLPKTVVLPLWPGDLAEIRAWVAPWSAFWRSVSVARSARYLGFLVGPEAAEDSWAGPLAKFVRRCEEWRHQGLGMHLTGIAFNVFAHSVLQFVAQLMVPSAEVVQAEKEQILRLCVGPRHWLPWPLPFYLREAFGGVSSFKSIELVAQASHIRVLYWEAVRGRAPRIRQMAEELRALRTSTNWLGRATCWRT